MFNFGVDTLTCAKLVELSRIDQPDFKLTNQSRDQLQKFRSIVDSAVQSGETYYGINTGFGLMSDVSISDAQLGQLQFNLVRSHACGVGLPAKPEVARGLMILKAHNFCLGHSGVRVEVVEKIFEFLKAGLSPFIPVKGSVGASGDLAPMAHMALGLIGEGRIVHKGVVKDAAKCLKDLAIDPLELSHKEGLSLINGTQFMTVLGSFAIERSANVAKIADLSAAASLDAIRGTVKAFDPRIQGVRQQIGQKTVAMNMLKILNSEENEVAKSHEGCGKVQDPYSFRCVPQVHGASRDAISYAKEIVEREINSVTDNPLVFENGDILSGGNFHGQPVALAMDILKIAVAEFGSISERRTEKLTDPKMSGLPAFIIKDGGLNSGYMIPHVVAAALVSENKILCHPAVIDSIPTSADKEDHVSMGPIAARKALEVVENVENILSIEILAALQGLDLLEPLKSSDVIEKLRKFVRSFSPRMDQDRSLEDDIRILAGKIGKGEVTAELESQGALLA